MEYDNFECGGRDLGRKFGHTGLLASPLLSFSQTHDDGDDNDVDHCDDDGNADADDDDYHDSGGHSFAKFFIAQT